MQLSPDAIQTILTSGEALEWRDARTNKQASIRLTTPVQRRLLTFLATSAVPDGKRPPDHFIQALKACFSQQESPPDRACTTGETAAKRTWLLKKIDTYGFGGLNTSSRQRFEYEPNAQSICLEGPNGSGKSSLTAAITWALTGRRVHEQVQPSDSAVPQPVLDKQDRTVASWPPLATYPADLNSMSTGAKVGVKLTLYDFHTGEEATVVRRRNADGQIVCEIDPRITGTLGFSSLVSAGVVLPNRLSYMRIGERPGSLADAVQSLTGLDSLAKVGDLVSELCNGNLEFRRYARRMNQAQFGQNFSAALRRVEQRLPAEAMRVKPLANIRGETLQTELASFLVDLESRASSAVTTIAGEFPPDSVADAGKARALMASVQVAIDELPKALERAPTFKALDALVGALDGVQTDQLQQELKSITVDLQAARGRIAQQATDSRLRLKVVAARWHREAHPDAPSVDECPLCERALDGLPVSREIFELRTQHELAERTFSQACEALCARLRTALPTVVRSNLELFATLDPLAALQGDLTTTLLNNERYQKHLLGIATRLARHRDQIRSSVGVPAGLHGQVRFDDPDVLMACVERMLVLKDWWTAARREITSDWEQLLAGSTQHGRGELMILETASAALSNAQPLKEAADEVRGAMRDAAEWAKIEIEQKLRDQIADAIAPLKSLRSYVEAQSAEAIASLSVRIGELLNRIYLLDALKYDSTSFDRQSVAVRGAFTEHYRIDATLVANTSWLRAYLWAFIFAYRSELLGALPSNPLPLLLLDDPQSTFDPQHRRKWAELIASLHRREASDRDHAQVFLTTHDPSFVEVLTTEGFQGRLATIHPAISEVGGAVVLDGTKLEALWKRVQVERSPAASQEYLAQLRIEVESMLRLILRGEGASIRTAIWGDLRSRLESLNAKTVPPFNRPTFTKLLGLISPSIKEVKFINWSHHSKPEDVGFAQAEDVEKYWRKQLRDTLQECFSIRRDHLLHYGDRPLAQFPRESVPFPDGAAEAVRGLSFPIHGRAAAMSNGRVADGMFSVEDFSGPCQMVSLKTHSAYRLVANTLEPVASAGDVLIVRNDPRVNAKNLVITTACGRMCARRFDIDEANPELAILSAQSVNPYDLRAPIVVGSAAVQARKIVGVCFDRHHYFGPLGGDDEFCEIEGESVVRNMGQDIHGLYRVEGRSAEPYALDGQYLMVGRPVVTATNVRVLDGRMVLAVDDSGHRYLKRLRLPEADIVVLESLDISGRETSIVLGKKSSGGGWQLASVSPVLGVLFEASVDQDGK